MYFIAFMFDLKDIKLESANQNFKAYAILENGLDDTVILKLRLTLMCISKLQKLLHLLKLL